VWIFKGEVFDKPAEAVPEGEAESAAVPGAAAPGAKSAETAAPTPS
jgi:hypothetical protein